MKLTKPQQKELVRRHNLSVLSTPGEEIGPLPMPRGSRIVCRRLRKLGFLDKSNNLKIAGVQKALELGGDMPENTEGWLNEQVVRLLEAEETRHAKVSDILKLLGESDLKDGAEEEFYELVAAAQLEVEA